MNVVSLMDRIQAASKQASKLDEALEHNYEPDVEDIRTFLYVLRHFQKQSSNQVAAIKMGSDLFELQISEIVDNDATSTRTSFMDHTETTRTLAFNLPWGLFDLDESEIYKDDEGIDVIDHFCASVLKCMNNIQLTQS